MKKPLYATYESTTETVANPQLFHQLTRNGMRLFYLIVLLSTFLFNGCKKEDIGTPENGAQLTDDEEIATGLDISSSCTGLNSQTKLELQHAREATAKYRNINNAIADGYGDINVIMQNMGYHYMKSKFTDAVFEVRRPELLVYNKHKDGSFQLVAVEYAVPLDKSPNAPPKGFTGSRDVWDHNTTFGLWTLHAWIWKNNPEGVFNPTNPLVHVMGAESRVVSCAPEKE